MKSYYKFYTYNTIWSTDRAYLSNKVLKGWVVAKIGKELYTPGALVFKIHENIDQFLLYQNINHFRHR